MLYPKLAHQQPVGGASFPIFVLMHTSLPSSKPSKTVTRAPHPRVSVASPPHGRIAQPGRHILRLPRKAFLLPMGPALAAAGPGPASAAPAPQVCHPATLPLGEHTAE